MKHLSILFGKKHLESRVLKIAVHTLNYKLWIIKSFVGKIMQHLHYATLNFVGVLLDYLVPPNPMPHIFFPQQIFIQIVIS